MFFPLLELDREELNYNTLPGKEIIDKYTTNFPWFPPKMSCCPPNAEGFLAANYSTKGALQTLPSGLEFYLSGTGSKAILIIPDVFGWNGGRTRNIADMLADAGYMVMIPKLMVPPLEGGTDGDGLFPDFSFEAHGAKFGPYMSQFAWEGNIQPKVSDCLGFLKSQGASSIGMLGFCWGGWVIAKALASEDTSMTADVTCGAIAHPSVSIEAMLFQGDVGTIFSKICKPLLLMPAKGDPAEYHPGGAWFESLKKTCPASESILFLEENHGFLSRGDIVASAATKTAVDSALAKVFAFYASNMG
mmetsp:Transcript_3187/g.4979  ORF Transcript_3187/g.4979 Transcript_3187/m.4979 type:complete len:303 (-) Transcript_3187:285-1193(-)